MQFNDRSAFRDPRVSDYLPPCRVVAAGGVDSPERLLGKRVIQSGNSFTLDDEILLKSGGFILFDFGREISGGVRLVTGRRGGRVRICFGESVSEALQGAADWHTIHDIELQLPGMGATDFGNTGFRFVRVSAVSDLPLIGFCAISRYLELEQPGDFHCSDECINRVWQTAVRTVHLNMQDYLLDGIKRDRLVWMGDLHPEISVVNLVFGDTAVVRKSLDFIRDTTVLPEWMNTLSSYSLWWLICQRDIYMHHGDMEYLKSQHEYVSALTHQLAAFIAPDGRECLPEKRFIDWPTAADPAAIDAGLQALMVMAFNSVALLAGYLDDRKLALFAGECEAKLRSCPVPESGRKAPNALQVLAKLRPAAEVNKRILSVDPLCDVGTFMGFYTLSARAEAGDIAGVLQLIRGFWGAMLDMGATTFWEDFDIEWCRNACRIDEVPVPGKRDIHADCGAYCYKGLRHSLCHGWAGGPAAVLSKYVSGLEIIEPGFRKIKLRPMPGPLAEFSCRIPTPHGVITVEQCRGQDSPRIDLPAGVELV